MHIENYLIRHHANHKFKAIEPILPDAYDETELHEVLTAAVRSLDQSGHTPTRLSQPQPVHAGVAAITAVNLPSSSDNDFIFEEEYMEDFAAFCDEDLTTTDPAF
jgi:hypothetical protein